MKKEKLNELINLVKRSITLSDLGCLYAHNGYDNERYHEMKDINMQILNIISENSMEELCSFYLPAKEYPTPKVDIRGVLLNEQGQILMVEEKLDPGKMVYSWRLGRYRFYSVRSYRKEMKEETGLDVEVERVLAVYRRKMPSSSTGSLLYLQNCFSVQKNFRRIKKYF